MFIHNAGSYFKSIDSQILIIKSKRCIDIFTDVYLFKNSLRFVQRKEALLQKSFTKSILDRLANA